MLIQVANPHIHGFQDVSLGQTLAFNVLINVLRVSLCKCCTLVVDIGSLYQRLGVLPDKLMCLTAYVRS